MSTAKPTMCLQLYRLRPLLGWPAPDTVKVIETMTFFGGMSELNEFFCVGWTLHNPLKEPRHG